jgi:hypothetical protein
MLPWLVLIRLHQWYKNLLCLVPALLTPALTLVDGLLLLAAFCFVSSAVYVFNDWVDRNADAQTLDRLSRPLACGLISSGQALAAIPLLGLMAILLWPAGYSLLGLGLYGVINLAYSLIVKPHFGYGMTTALLVLGCYLSRTVPLMQIQDQMTLAHGHLLLSLALVIFPLVIWKQRSYLLEAARWPLWMGQAGLSVGIVPFLGEWSGAGILMWILGQYAFVRIYYDRSTREPCRALFGA